MTLGAPPPTHGAERVIDAAFRHVAAHPRPVAEQHPYRTLCSGVVGYAAVVAVVSIVAAYPEAASVASGALMAIVGIHTATAGKNAVQHVATARTANLAVAKE